MLSNNTSLNILRSYAYCGQNEKETKRLVELSKLGKINLMIDSGAFTVFNAKGTNTKWVTVDNYCRFLEGVAPYVEKYVALDVIANEMASKKNYEVMVSRGFAPMWVLTAYDNDWSYLNDTMNINRNICVAGGVTSKGKWTLKRYQDAYKMTSGKALIHGLGFVTYPKMYQLPLASVDSSSWITGASRFGNWACFESNTDDGILMFNYKEVLSGKRKVPQKIGQLFDKLEITKQNVLDWYSDGGVIKWNTKGYYLTKLLSIIAFQEYQRYSMTQNLRLFLAVGGITDVESLIWVKENWEAGTLTYLGYVEKVRKEKLV